MKINALISTALAGLLALTGCMVSARGHVAAPVAVVEIEEEPPPPRVVQVVVRPGFVYVQGRWVRHGGRWVWRDGYYERERVGYVYQQGRWDRRGNRHVWVDGGWNAQPVVRDHREHHEHREGRHERRGGPIVRDHR